MHSNLATAGHSISIQDKAQQNLPPNYQKPGILEQVDDIGLEDNATQKQKQNLISDILK